MARPLAKLSTSGTEACRLLKTPQIQSLIQSYINSTASDLSMSKQEWLRLAADTARFDIRQYLQTESGSGDVQLVEDWQSKPGGHALESVELATTTLESGQVVQRVKLKASSKMKALELVGKAMGYIEDEAVHLHLQNGVSPELRAHMVSIQEALDARRASEGLPPVQPLELATTDTKPSGQASAVLNESIVTEQSEAD